MSPDDVVITRVEWPAARPALASVREQVFIREQGVPEALEWDGFDESAIHLLATDELGTSVGTARLTASGQIGRMAVLPGWRYRGVGSALLAETLEAARQAGFDLVFLNAQARAIPFYERFGFHAAGPVFSEADIPHRRMELRLRPDGAG